MCAATISRDCFWYEGSSVQSLQILSRCATLPYEKRFAPSLIVQLPPSARHTSNAGVSAELALSISSSPRKTYTTRSEPAPPGKNVKSGGRALKATMELAMSLFAKGTYATCGSTIDR